MRLCVQTLNFEREEDCLTVLPIALVQKFTKLVYLLFEFVFKYNNITNITNIKYDMLYYYFCTT